MAHFANDAALLSVLNMGGDVIRAIAAQWLEKPVMEVTMEERSQAKKMMYSLLYGKGVYFAL